MIAVIDVSGNNLSSLGFALSRLGYEFKMTHDAQDIKKASHIILPGVGTAASGMSALRKYQLLEPLTAAKQPLLGICLGMQLLLDYSDEGQVPCLGLIPGRAELLKKDKQHPVPHMGWNQLQWVQATPLLNAIKPEDSVYFVHSYALKSSEFTVANCLYGEAFAAVVQKDNIFGMQFHPEKSAEVGMTLLKNFLNYEGEDR